ncbi:MAG: ORF6N domain-containing protein, partial [Steroidobacteraceae bacterium]
MSNDIDLSQNIRVIRGQRVLLDEDLAALYGVPTKVFNQAVRRNAARFPADFLLQLTEAEGVSLRSQIGDGLIISVEEMTVAGNDGTQANESRRPKQDGRWVRTSP